MEPEAGVRKNLGEVQELPYGVTPSMVRHAAHIRGGGLPNSQRSRGGNQHEVINYGCHCSLCLRHGQ